MRPDKHFRMKSTSKVLIALSGGNAESRAQLKRMMIDAQLCEESAIRSSKRSKDQNNKNIAQM